MSRVSDIVKYLNDTWKENALSRERFSPCQMYGIATQTPRNYDGSEITDSVLSVIAPDGSVEADSLAYDPAYAVQVYHRLWSSQMFPDMRDEGFGHKIEYSRRLAMSALIYMDKKRVNMNSEDMELVLLMSFPTSIPKSQLPAGFASVQFFPLGGDFNQVNLLLREFNLKDYTLGPEVVLLELKYQIECTYQKDCINTLCCD